MSPIDIQDILDRAKDASRVGDHEEAGRLLKNYIAKVPESREARLLLGTTFAKQGKLTEAADEFIALLAREPKDIEALNNAAVIYRRQGKLQEALDYLKDAVDIDPTRAEFHYNIGNIHKQLGNSKAASMAYARVIELDPSYVSAYNNLGTIYEQLKEYDKAFGVFRKGLAQDQNNPNLHFNYGVALEASGRLDDASNEYRAALRSKPGWLAPMNNLGIILFKQGRHDKAMATFKRILNVDPINAEAFNNMGVVLADQGRTQESVKCYRQAIEADPRYTKAVVNLERALEASGNFSDALIELEKLVKLSPDSADIRNRLAGLYLKLERYPEALNQAESALDWEPESVQALRIKGSVQRVLGDDDEAQKSFEKILSLDPGNYSFLLDLSDIHFKRKEYKEAEERIQAYLIRRPNDKNAKMLLGKLYAEMGNDAHAIQIFEDLSRTDPNDTEALAAAAELHKKAGSLEKALRTADTLVNLQGKRATADDLSELNKSLEFYESAVNAYTISAKEMWNQDKKSKEDEEEETGGDDISMFMGAAEVSHDMDEEIETLFTEGAEYIPEEEIDLTMDDEPFIGIMDDSEMPLGYRDPLDALVNDQAEAPEKTYGRPPAGQEDYPGAGRGAPAMPQEAPVPYYPQYPQYPQYPVIPPSMPQPAIQPEPLPHVPEPEPLAEPIPEPDFSPAPEDDFLMEEPLLTLGDEAGEDSESALGEETREDIYGEVPPNEPALDDDFFIEDEVPSEPLLESAAEEPIEEPIIEEPAAQEETAVEENLSQEPLAQEPLAQEPLAQEPLAGEFPEEGDAGGLFEVVGLLKYLKSLTKELPERKQNAFIKGKYPKALDSVIDSLKKLAIIKRSADRKADKDGSANG